MQTEKEGELAFKTHQQIIKNELARREFLGTNIYLLKQMKDKGFYKAILGDENADWVDYLGQIEVFYSRNNVYNLMRIYDKFIIDFGLEYSVIADIPKSRLVTLLSVITKDNVHNLLDKARVLTSRDFSDEIKELKGLPTTDNCKHEYKQLEVCKHCGEKHELGKGYEEDK
jgi:hypothetical protein